MDQDRMLASIAATSHDCILSLDAAGVVGWASPAVHDVLGRTPEELAGRRFAELFPGGLGAMWTDAVDRVVAGRRVDPLVATATRADGSTFEAQLVLGPVQGGAAAVASGRAAVVGVVVILRDLTAQLLEQRSLAQALEMSRAYFNRSATPQAILGLDGRLESVNPAWCELFGHGEGWFADCLVVDLIHPDDGSAVMSRLARLGAGELDSFSYRGVFRDADGADLSLLLEASLLREPDGRPYAVAASVGPHDSEELRAALVRGSGVPVIVLDARLTLVHVAEPVARLLGHRCTDEPPAVRDLVHPTDLATVTAMAERLVAEPHRVERAVVRVRTGDDQWRSLEVAARNQLADPEIAGFVAELRDVTEQVQREEALRISEALHRSVVESAQDGILATSAQGLVVFANERAGELLDRPLEQLYGRDPRDLLGLDPSAGSSRELVRTGPDGNERTLAITVRSPVGEGPDGAGLGALVSLVDVTDTRRAELTLRRRALHDPLTGLPNRYLFRDRLDTAAARQRRAPGRGTAVLFLDLDGFKAVNDRHGHAAGDALLQAVALRLQTAVRATDTVGRLGGDEFAVICEDSGLDEARLVAGRILAELDAVLVAGLDVRARPSIGIALAPPCSFDEVVQRADEAMYRAKQAGGGCVAVADA